MGAYITNISDIDLMEDQFSIELLLWTLWHGDPDQNPSDQLRDPQRHLQRRYPAFRAGPPGADGWSKLEPLQGAFTGGEALAAAALSL